jgi:hypothetical protein
MCKWQRVIPRHKGSPRYRIAHGWKMSMDLLNLETLKFLMHFGEPGSSLYFIFMLYILIFFLFSFFLYTHFFLFLSFFFLICFFFFLKFFYLLPLNSKTAWLVRSSRSCHKMLDELISEVLLSMLKPCINTKLQNRHAQVNLLYHRG